jgi:hypothetical protein
VSTLVNVLGIVIADRVNKVLLAVTGVALLALVVAAGHTARSLLREHTSAHECATMNTMTTAAG